MRALRRHRMGLRGSRISAMGQRRDVETVHARRARHAMPDPRASFMTVIALRGSSALDPNLDIAVATTATGIAEPDLGSRGLRPFAIDPCCLSHKRGGPLINESDRSFCSKRLPTARSGNTRSGSPGASNRQCRAGGRHHAPTIIPKCKIIL
jgi:hypothetical protein